MRAKMRLTVDGLCGILSANVYLCVPLYTVCSKLWRKVNVLTYSVRKVIVVVACLSIFCLDLAAQSSYGSIVGTVTDVTGATIPGASVTLTNLGTAERHVVESDGSGGYQFVNLLPGDYRVEIEKTGFKHLTRGQVQVAVSSSTRVDAAMELGEVGQTVEVSGRAELLQTDNAAVGQVVDGRAVLEMPLNGRNTMNLIELAAGVIAHGQTQGQEPRSGWTNFQIAGGMVGQGRTILDGVSINTGLYNGAAFVPIQDTIQEFQVMQNNLPPEFGQTMNGVINLATKSGTNEYHGTAYEFVQNKIFNASPFFSNKAGLEPPRFTQNQYGLNGGGPIVRNKLFIFAAWEVFSQRLGSTTNFTVPTVALKQGDFSNLRSASGALITIYDPATTCGQFGNPACAAGQTALRTPFPGNQIPSSRFDKTAAIMLKYWPLPNAAGQPFTNAINYVTNYSTANDRNWENVRSDYNVSSKQRIFGSFNRWNNITPPFDPYGQGLAFYKPQFAHEGMLADTYTLSPTMILDARIGFSRHVFEITPTNFGNLDLSTFGWPASYNQQLLIQTMPVMAIQGFSSSSGGESGSLTHANITRQFADNLYLAASLTKIAGRHRIKLGGEFSWMPTVDGNSTTSTFNFTSNFTAANPLSPGNTGSGFASYLLGLGSTGSVGNLQIPMPTQKSGGLYVGDTFQVSKRLTLNLGVRWEYTGYWSERYNLATVFLPGATNPILGAAGLNYKGDVVLVNSPRYPYRTNLIPHWDLFSPRLGAAYRLNEKTVVRSGFGISYAPGMVQANLEPSASPINSATTAWLATQNSGLTPVATLSNPFPSGINLPAGRNPIYESTTLGQSLTVPIPGDATSYIMNWNFGFERQLSGTDLLEVSYIGTRGVHLLLSGAGGGGPNLNQLPTQYLSLGSQLLTPVANPFYGLIKTGSLAQPTIPYGQTLLPYPQYTQVYSVAADGFDTVYHALAVKYQKRLHAGGSLLVTYSWSKNTGNAETVVNREVANPGAPQNYNNMSAEHSLISYDVPHRLVVAYVVDLPIGKGKRLLGNVTGVADKLVSGWGVNGDTNVQSGFPLALTAQPTTLSTTFGAGTPRPNVTAGCNKIPDASSQGRITGWFNTACFSQPGTFGFGSEARTDPNIRVAGIANYNFALFKNTAITERFKLQFRAEAFNLFNRVQFGPPGATFGTAQFGVVSTQINNPRVIQLALRLSF
jgi:hypothetical protein